MQSPIVLKGQRAFVTPPTDPLVIILSMKDTVQNDIHPCLKKNSFFLMFSKLKSEKIRLTLYLVRLYIVKNKNLSTPPSI